MSHAIILGMAMLVGAIVSVLLKFCFASISTTPGRADPDYVWAALSGAIVVLLVTGPRALKDWLRSNRRK